MIAVLEAQEAAIVIGAVGALVVAILAPLLKVIVDIRKQTTETNIAVNHAPKGDATLREIAERTEDRLTLHVEAQTERHRQNVDRIERVYNRMSNVDYRMSKFEEKMDRLGSAVAGANDRLDALEGRSSAGDTLRERADIRREQADERRERRDDER